MDKQQSYFKGISQALNDIGCARPVLVLDKARVDHNIARLQQVLSCGFAFRLVAKSLPSLPLLEYVLTQTGSQRLMCFHLPFMLQVLNYFKQADILLGKPLPVAAMHYFERGVAAKKLPLNETYKRVQWLVDSPERLEEYEAFAAQHERKLRISLEIDVGLHRGGFSTDAAFIAALRYIKNSSYLSLSGLMGYEAHITKIPLLFGGPDGALKLAKAKYRQFVALVREEFGVIEGLCLNVGGSTTYPLYQHDDLEFCNELATASALVKPVDFDVFTLEKHQPAAWIATPVIKSLQAPALPGPQWVSRVMRSTGMLPKQACFIYGGNWLADPAYPAGAKPVALFGPSSNQEMRAMPAGANLKPGDWMFLRPRQSEAVLLQFGDIAVYENGQINDWWSVLNYPEGLDLRADTASKL